MNRFPFYMLAATLVLVASTYYAVADSRSLAYRSITEFATNTETPATGDYTLRFDASVGDFVRVDGTAAKFDDADFADDITVGGDITVNATSAISAIHIQSDAVASGQTSKTTTISGVTASSKCFATSNEVATNAAYIRAVVPSAGSVAVTVNTDPGASNMDYTVLCFN